MNTGTVTAADLTEDALDFLREYRSLDDRGKAKILLTIAALKENETRKNAELPFTQKSGS